MENRFRVIAKMTIATKYHRKDEVVEFGEFDTWEKVEEKLEDLRYGTVRKKTVSRKFVEIHDRYRGLCIRIGYYSTAAMRKSKIWSNEGSFCVVKAKLHYHPKSYYSTHVTHEEMFYFTAYDDAVDYMLGHKLGLRSHYIKKGCTKYNLRPLAKEHNYLKVAK